MISSLKLRAEEEKTTGTWFLPSDRVSKKIITVKAFGAARLNDHSYCG
jgi:hypothetical protein